MKSSFQSKDRIDWIDYAKGIGIFLVVVGHVLRGLMDSVGSTQLYQLRAIDTYIYAFHMPLFFFLSGLLSKKSEDKTIRAFLLDKFKNILYPYVVWSGIIGFLRVVSGQSGESLASFVYDFWRIIYQPEDIFWFLYVLFLISVVYFLARKMDIAPISILFGAFLLHITNLIHPQILSFWNPLERMAIYLPYFAIGAAIRLWLLNEAHASSMFLLLNSIFGFSILYCANYYGFLIPNYPNLIFGLIGITSCSLLAKILYQFEVLKFFRKWGYLSLQIYVVHTAAAALTRISLQRLFHVDFLPIHIILGIFTGIYLPILLTQGVEKIKFPYLFFIPKNLS